MVDSGLQAVVSYGVEGTGQLRSLGRTPVTSAARVGVHPSGRFLYVSAATTLHAYRIDRERGTLGLVGSYPDNWVASAPRGVAATSGYVYVPKTPATTGSRGALIGYRVDASTGALTLAGNVGGDLESRFAAIHSAETWLYSGGLLYRSPDIVLSTFVIGQDGTLFEAPRMKADSLATGGAMHPSGRLLYVAYGARVLTYALEGRSGLPSELAVLALPESVVSLALEPGGRFLCAAGSTAVRMYATNIGTGSLTLVDEVTLPTTQTRHAAFEPGARFLYVSTSGDGVRGFAVDGSTGTLGEIGHATEGGGSLVLVATTASSS